MLALGQAILEEAIEIGLAIGDFFVVILSGADETCLLIRKNCGR